MRAVQALRIELVLTAHPTEIVRRTPATHVLADRRRCSPSAIVLI